MEKALRGGGKMALIEVDRVKKFYGRVEVFNGISLNVETGEFVALLGPSGCGKSTLLRMIAGLERPDAGEIRFRGEPVRGPRREIALMFQSPTLLPWKSALDNVALPLVARGMGWREAREAAARFLSFVGLSGFEEAYPKQLSGGMQQRVALARALAVEPEVLLLDEPFSALDPLTAESLRSELVKIWHENLSTVHTVVMVTHAVDEAVYMANRIVVLSARPAKVVADLRIDLPYSRNRKSHEFQKYLDQVYSYI
nr:ABC transporter ATP-binding protein [Pyrobaculum ferrireducens]